MYYTMCLDDEPVIYRCYNEDDGKGWYYILPVGPNVREYVHEKQLCTTVEKAIQRLTSQFIGMSLAYLDTAHSLSWANTWSVTDHNK